MSFEEFQDLNLYITPMPPIKLWLRIMVWEEMSFEEFQDGHSGGHLGYWNRTILVILNLCVTVMPPTKFQLKQTTVLEMLLEEFQDGRHLGYLNRTILFKQF